TGNVFIDMGNIPVGVDFREHIHRILEQCDLLLAVVGSGWLGRSPRGGTASRRKTTGSVRRSKPHFVAKLRWSPFSLMTQRCRMRPNCPTAYASLRLFRLRISTRAWISAHTWIASFVGLST